MPRFVLSTIAALALLGGVASSALAYGPKNFDAKSVSVENVFGDLKVTVSPTASRATLVIAGPSDRQDKIKVRLDDGKLRIEQEREGSEQLTDRDKVAINVTVPQGLGLAIERHQGDADIGDLNGPLSVQGLYSGTIRAGDVTVAALTINGSGDISLGKVREGLMAQIKGSGDIIVGETKGGMSVEITGSGDLKVERVSGVAAVQIKGSGDVLFENGTIDALSVVIFGSGSLTLDGITRQQSIVQNGSGKVTITGRAS
jgi:Putative auto-transporter adhesin, head GIN domain